MKKFVKNYISYVILFVGILTFIMMFLPALKITVSLFGFSSSSEITGIQAVFGEEDSFKFNVISLIGWLLPIIGGIVALLKGKMTSLITCILFLVGAILIILEKTFFVSVNDLSNVKDAISLLTGPILGFIFAVIGTILSGIKVYYTK